MMGSFITRGIIMVLGYVYPAYECFKIVEKKRPDLEHLRFWCQYWMIIAVVTVLERVGDVLVSWVPMYSEAKLAFIIYLWYPKTMGTTYVYTTFVRPFVARHEPEIDRNLNELRTRAGDVAFFWWQRGSVYAQARFYELLQYVALQSNRNPRASIPPPVAPHGPPRPPPQGPPRGPPQGGPQMYPPKPSQGGFPDSAAGAAGYPPVNLDGAYPPSGLGPYPGPGPYPPQGPYPPGPGNHAGQGLRRASTGSGSRALVVEEEDVEQDYDVIEPRSEKRLENRSERPVPSAGEQDVPPRAYNTRTRQQRSNSGGQWNMSVWFPTWLGSSLSDKGEKVD